METEIYNYKTWISLTVSSVLEKQMSDLLEQSGFTVLQHIFHHFEPQGFTAIWLLSESHLAIHTFPEAGKTYLELSSCNLEKNKKFQELLKAQYF